MAEKKDFPSIQKLFQDAWGLFKKTWVSYLKLLGLSIAFVFLGALIGVIIALPISFIGISSHFQLFRHLTPFNISILVLLAAWTIIYLLSIIAMGVSVSIVSIYILQGKKAASIIDLIKQSKRFFWPYFLTTLLTALLVLGGSMLLVIPGLLIGFFLCFVGYEVVIDEKSGVTALKRSYVMIRSHFWEVLGRLILLEVGIIIVMSVLQRLATGDPLLGLVQFLFSLFVSWFARSYIFLLYKEVHAKTTFPDKASLLWIWIVAVIGWVVILLLTFVVVPQLSHLAGMHQNHLRSASHHTV